MYVSPFLHAGDLRASTKPSPNEGLEPSTTRLKGVRSTDWANWVNEIFIVISSHMHEVGFEPTQRMLPGLKSGSLDHSDIRA